MSLIISVFRTEERRKINGLINKLDYNFKLHKKNSVVSSILSA